MENNIIINFCLQILYGTFTLIPIYLAAYFSSSYFLFNTEHGSISKWENVAQDLGIAVNPKKIITNDNGTSSKICNIVSGPTKTQIIDLSNCIALMNRAEDRLEKYKASERFIIFGFILSLSFSLINAFPILLNSEPFVKNPLAYSTAIAVAFNLAFIFRFNWTQSIEWNKFKETVAINKKILENNGF